MLAVALPTRPLCDGRHRAAGHQLSRWNRRCGCLSRHAAPHRLHNHHDALRHVIVHRRNVRDVRAGRFDFPLGTFAKPIRAIATLAIAAAKMFLGLVGGMLAVASERLVGGLARLGGCTGGFPDLGHIRQDSSGSRPADHHSHIHRVAKRLDIPGDNTHRDDFRT